MNVRKINTYVDEVLTEGGRPVDPPARTLRNLRRFSDPAIGSPLPGLMVGSTVGLLGLALAFTFAAGPMYDYVSRSATALLDGSYVAQVLGGGG